MNEQTHDSPPSGMSLSDIYFVLFRRKWIILFFSAMGICGAFAALVIRPAKYQSEATLQIKYLSDKSPLPPGSEPRNRPIDDRPEGIINTEMHILGSWDLCLIVASNVTPRRLLGSAANNSDFVGAAAVVMDNLLFEPDKGSVLSIYFQHTDPKTAQETLNEVISAYARRRAAMYQPIPMTTQLMTEQTNRLTVELARTQDELRAAKRSAGIVSLEEDQKAAFELIRILKNDLAKAESELAQHTALVNRLSNAKPASATTTNAPPTVPKDMIAAYAALRDRLEMLNAKKRALLANNFKETSIFVQDLSNQIIEVENSKKKMEASNPLLESRAVIQTAVSTPPAGLSLDLPSELAIVDSLVAKTNVLNANLQQANATVTKIAEVETSIRELERKRKLQEDSYNFYMSSLEQNRLKSNLGFSREEEGISILQWPTPPAKKWSKPFKKKVAMVGLGGICFGLGLAFLIELVFDRSLKRPGQVVSKLGLPLLISIPKMKHGKNQDHGPPVDHSASNLRDTDDATNRSKSTGGANVLSIAVAKNSDPLQRFYEGLRDRLIVYFEVRNFAQKPKLVAVTSCGKGAGVSTMAVGLAATLSETGDGNVLLVDMNAEQGASQAFYKGKPGCALDEALTEETKGNALVHANLYLATERLNGDELPRALPTRFAKLLPKLKASDYDYIIFDMPPVSQTSMTPRLSRLMDMVLLVIESEKTSQDVAKHTVSLLAESHANVGAVLNKTRRYVPTQLHQDFMDNG